MWAHAEYIKLLRSTADGKVYDSIPEVAKRYLGKRPKRKQLEVWKPNRHVRFMRTGQILRVHGETAFTLRWPSNDWKTVQEMKSIRNALNIDYADLSDVITSPGTCIRFTFHWTDTDR